MEGHLAFLLDTRSVHREIFGSLTPEGYEAYAGTYRGEEGSILEHRKAAIHYKNVEGLKERYPALNPAEVILYMRTLEDFIRDVSWGREFRQRGIFHEDGANIWNVQQNPPYLDGNGHISRMMMVLLAERKSIEVSPKWTVHPRPYGIEMSIAFEHYKTALLSFNRFCGYGLRCVNFITHHLCRKISLLLDCPCFCRPFY